MPTLDTDNPIIIFWPPVAEECYQPVYVGSG